MGISPSLSHNPAKFGCHKYCCSEDKMFMVVEEQVSTCLLPNYCLSHMAWKHIACHVNKFDVCDTCLE